MSTSRIWVTPDTPCTGLPTNFYLYGFKSIGAALNVGGTTGENGFGVAVQSIQTVNSKNVYIAQDITVDEKANIVRMYMDDGTCKFYFGSVSSFSAASWSTYTSLSNGVYNVSTVWNCRTANKNTPCSSNPLNRYYLYGSWIYGNSIDNGTGMLVTQIEEYQGKKIYIVKFPFPYSGLIRMAMSDGTCRQYWDNNDFSINNWPNFTQIPNFACKIGLLWNCRTVVTSTTPLSNTISRYYMYGAWTNGGAENIGRGTPISRIEMIDNKPVFMAEEYFVNQTKTEDFIYTKMATLDGINRHYKGTVQDFSASNWGTYYKNDTAKDGVNYRVGLLQTLRTVSATTPCDPTLPYYLYGTAVTGTSNTDNGTGIPVVRLEFINGMPVFIAEEFTNGILYTKMAMPDGTCKFYIGIAQEFSSDNWAFYNDMPAGSYRVGNYRTCAKKNIITPYTELPPAMCEPKTRFYMYGTGIFGNDADNGSGIPVVQITTAVGRTVFVAEDTVNTPPRTKILWLFGNVCKYYDGPASQFSMAAFDSYNSVAENSYRVGVSKFCKDRYGLDFIQSNEPCNTTPIRRYYLYGKDISVDGSSEDSKSGLAITSIERYNNRTYFCAKEFKNGKPIVYIKDADFGFKTYDNTNNDFVISKWDTLPMDADPNCKIGVRLECFTITEIQLRLYSDPLTRALLGIKSRTIEATNYDPVSNLLFVATLDGTKREILSYDCKHFPTTTPTYTGIHTPNEQQTAVRGFFYWKNQTYLLYTSRFGRVNALGLLELVAGKAREASTRTTPYGKADTNLGYNMTFANLTDVCFDTQEESFYLVDATQNGVYKLSNEGVITSLCSGSANMATLFEDGERNGEECFIPAPTGITLGPDGTLYVSSETYNQVYRIRKTFTNDGKEQYMVSIVAGFSATAGTVRATGETAKYSKPNQPRRIRYGTDGALYFIIKRANGADGVARIQQEQYNTYYKGFTGAIQYAPIQVIGNNTTEGNIITVGNTSSAITAEFFAMHIVADDDGNLYFPDTKTGRILMMDLNNQITTLNSSDQLIFGAYSIAIYKNTMLYIATESATDSKLYSFDLLTKTLTQIPLILEDGRNWQGSIKCLFVKQSGILFIGGFVPNIVSYILIEQSILRIYGLSFIVEDYNTAEPCSMCVDNNDNLYVTTTQNLIWKIPLGENASLLFSSGSVQTNILSIVGGKKEIFAGNKTPISTGDGGLARNAGIAKPFGICYSKDDNSLYFTTFGDPTPAPSIRRIDLATNIISTYMGLTRSGYPVHGSTTASSTLMSPAGIWRDVQGNLLVLDVLGSDFLRNRTRLAGEGDRRSSLLFKIPSKLFFLQEYVYPLIGTGLQASRPETGLAVNTKFASIRGIGADFNGNVFFTSDATHSVFRYDALKETVTCIAGSSGQAVFSGDGGSAATANLNTPTYIQVTTDGTVYVFDSGNNRIRRIVPFVDGTYQIITFIETAGPISGLTVDAYENVIYSVNNSRTITIVNQYKATKTIQPGCQVGGIFAQGINLYFLNTDTRRIEMYTAPYTTKTVYSVALSNPLGQFVIDSKQNIYYLTTAHQIRRVTSAADNTYVGQNGVADFYDGVLPTAGIKDNRYRSIVLLNDPRAIGIDSFDRIFFSDQRGNRIRCIPTGIQLNECFVSARYILIEAGVAGKEFTFSDFKVYSEENKVYPLPTDSNFIGLPLRTYLYDLGSMKNVSYIQCKTANPDSIGAKVYLLNETRDILSLRSLSSISVSTTGETLVYAVPWTTTCSFAQFVKIQKDCGIPNVRLIELTNTDVNQNPVVVRALIKELVVVTRIIDISNNMYTLQTQRFKETDRATFTNPTEILGMFVFRKNTATDRQLEGIQIQVYDSDKKQRPPILTKKIVSLTRVNTMYEFIDFRQVISEFGCSTLDAIYASGLNLNRVRYIRILKAAGTQNLQLSQIVAISQESAENVASGRIAYTSSAQIITNVTDGNNSKVSNFYNEPHDWLEVDLGKGMPLEQVVVYPPQGMYFDYTIQCFTENRDFVPIPALNQNFMDTRVAKIRVQGSGYNDAWLQTEGLFTRPIGRNLWDDYSRITGGTFFAETYWDLLTSSDFFTGSYHSRTPFQREFFEVTLPTPQSLNGILFRNRRSVSSSENFAYRQYGNQLLMYNSVGRLLQRECIMGYNLGGMDPTWGGMETFAISETIPRPVAYCFPSSKQGIKNVRFVRFSNTTLSTNKIQIAQLVVLDTQGINRALFKTPTTFSNESVNRRISLQSSTVINQTLDYTLLSTRYKIGNQNNLFFYFLYLGTYYRARFPAAGQISIERYIGLTWQTITSNDAIVRSEATIQVFNDNAGVITTPFAAVDGSQVPSASKLYRSAGAGADEFFMVDLGDTYEIDSVIYYNSTENRHWSTGDRIELLDVNQTILASKRLVGGMLRESLDFRPEADVSLRARYVRFENPGLLGTGKPPVYSAGDGLTNPGRLRLANVRIYDIYKRNVAKGKEVIVRNVSTDSGASPESARANPINTTEYYVTSMHSGSFWEVDLGQEYSLTEIQFKADPAYQNDYRNTIISLYNDEHVVIQTYALTHFSDPSRDYSIPVGINPVRFGNQSLGNNTAVSYDLAQTTTNIEGRYVRINFDTLTGVIAQLRQIIILDDGYRNISLGKPTSTNTGNVEAFQVPYAIVDGKADRVFSFRINTNNNFVEIDLGALFPISAILLYGGANILNIQIFGESRRATLNGTMALHTIDTNTINMRGTMVPLRILPLTSVLPFTTSVTPTSFDMNSLLCCLPKFNAGRRARYVRLQKWRGAQNGFILSQIVITDALGRNVALNKSIRCNVQDGWWWSSGRYPTSLLVNGNYMNGTNNFFVPFANYGTTKIFPLDGPAEGTIQSYFGYQGEIYIDIDLGDEYWITDVTLYTSKYEFNNFGHWSKDIEIHFRDTYQNFVGEHLRTTDRIWNYTFLMETEKYVKSFSCPPGTELRNGKCIVPCGNLGAGYEEIDGQCWLPPGPGEIIMPNNNKQYGYCDSAKDRIHGTQCKEFCTGNNSLRDEKGYSYTDNSDEVTCDSLCQNDEHGRPTEHIGSNICRTKNYDGFKAPGSRTIYNIFDGGRHWEGYKFDAWGCCGIWDDYEWWYNGSKIWTLWTRRFNEYKAKDEMRQIFTTTKPGPHTRRFSNLLARTRVSQPFTERPMEADPVSNSHLYDPIGTSYYIKYFNWSSTTVGDFMRDANNSAYIKGRYLAETFNLLGRVSRLAVPLQIPAPPPKDCPPGFFFDSTRTTQQCKSQKQTASWTERAGSYFAPCPSNYIEKSSDPTRCSRICSSLGSRYTEASNQIECEDVCDSGYSLVSGACVMNCPGQRDSNNRPMQDDTSTGKCVTAVPSILNPTWTTNIQKVKVTEPGQSDKYAWIDINWPEWTRRSDSPWTNWQELKPPIELTCNQDWAPWKKDENGLFRLWFDCDKTPGCSNAVEYGITAFKYILRMDYIKVRSGYSSDWWGCNYNGQWIEERKKANPRTSLYDKFMNMFATGQFAWIEYKDKSTLPRLPNVARDEIGRQQVAITYADTI